MKKSRVILVYIAAVIIFVILCYNLGCPSRGAGVLYIYGHGGSRAVPVKSVSFWTSTYTSYTDMGGVRHITSAPVRYVPCKDVDK